jgi:predicted lipoprotein with Yx(FWY)xxD motif
MRLKTLVFSLSLALPLVGVLAACGTAPLTTVPSATPTTVPGATLTTVPSTAPTIVPSATPTGSASSVTATTTTSSIVVSVGQVPSHQAVGSTFTVLTTVNGFTLYVHEWQGASGFTCDGSCARTWKPLVYHGTGNPAATTHLPGKLSIGTDAQGRRVVFYQGYPLYTYVGDTKPGDFNAPLADNSPWQPAVPNISTGL